MLVSVVITNYNYGRFLRESVESVLAQTYRHFQLIVVDDGSTDDSRELLREYQGRAELVLKGNGGQGSAVNAGFEKVAGDLVLFLDSDDVLKPDALETIVAAWRPGDVKLQFRLECMDAEGRPLGPAFPRLLHEGDVRPIIRRFGRFQYSMTSGGAFAADAVRKVLPMDEPHWRTAVDLYLSCTCAFLGGIRNIPRPLGRYRLHLTRAARESNLRGNTDQSGMGKFLRIHEQSGYVLESLKKLGFVPRETVFKASPGLAEIHLLVARTAPDYDARRWGSVAAVTYHAIVSFSTWPRLRTLPRLMLLAWIVAVAIAPAGVARRIYGWKQNTWTMPRPLQRIAGWVFGHRGAGAP